MADIYQSYNYSSTSPGAHSIQLSFSPIPTNKKVLFRYLAAQVTVPNGQKVFAQFQPHGYFSAVGFPSAYIDLGQTSMVSASQAYYYFNHQLYCFGGPGVTPEIEGRRWDGSWWPTGWAVIEATLVGDLLDL